MRFGPLSLKYTCSFKCKVWNTIDKMELGIGISKSFDLASRLIRRISIFWTLGILLTFSVIIQDTTTDNVCVYDVISKWRKCDIERELVPGTLRTSFYCVKGGGPVGPVCIRHSRIKSVSYKKKTKEGHRKAIVCHHLHRHRWRGAHVLRHIIIFVLNYTWAVL